MLRRLRRRWTDEALPDVWKDTTTWNSIYGCLWLADNLATLSVWSLFLFGRRTLCLALHPLPCTTLRCACLVAHRPRRGVWIIRTSSLGHKRRTEETTQK